MANKKINELTQATGIVDTDLLLIETSDGTCSIPYEKIREAIGNSDNAASHNGIFRGKDLTGLGINEICSRISCGEFKDLYIGDYFDIVINGESGEETVRCILAGFNNYWNMGNTVDTAFKTHHAVIVTKNCLETTHRMNETNTSEGGFFGSDMWETVIPFYNDAFGAVFGNHLLTHQTLITIAINTSLNSMVGNGYTGASSSWAWKETKLSLLSDIQVFGNNICCSSMFDSGCECSQLQLFALDTSARVCGKGGTESGDRNSYWLRTVMSENGFANVNANGAIGPVGAIQKIGVRPIFCIG